MIEAYTALMPSTLALCVFSVLILRVPASMHTVQERKSLNSAVEELRGSLVNQWSEPGTDFLL